MNILSKIAGTAALLLMFSSCNKDDDNTPAPVVQNTPTGTYITAKVDGSDFTSFIAGSSIAVCSHNATTGTTLISAGDTSSNSITLTIQDITATGTYTVNEDSMSLLAYATSTKAYTTGGCPGVSGTIVVTALDSSHIEGTFSFTGKDSDSDACAGPTKTITDGHFRGNF